MNAKFTPINGAPMIELVAGRHTKDGRFVPKNVHLTKITRLRYYESSNHWREHGYRPFPMVGDPSRDVNEIYAHMMKQKRQQCA